MSKVKRKIQNEGLAEPKPIHRDHIKKGNPIPPSAKDQFFELREPENTTY